SQLGANPTALTADQLIFNRGWLYVTNTFAISNSNRGILIGVNDGIFDVTAGATLTVASPLSSGMTIINGNQLTTQAEQSGVVAGCLIKQNAGTLVLKSTNSGFTGMLEVDSGSATANDGVVSVVNNAVLANAGSPIGIRNSGSGSSTLQLDGTLTNLSLSQAISLNGRNNVIPAVQNLAGTNTIAGGLSTYGSGSYVVQVDGGVLNLGGSITSADGGADILTIQGNGLANISGTLSGAIGLNKAGNGSLMLAAGSSYTGPTTVSQGTLSLAPSLGPVLHFTFNNAAGSGNGSIITNTGTAGAALNGVLVTTGGATIASGGRFGNALSLTGVGGVTTNNIVIVSNKCVTTDAAGTWSVGYWLKTATAGAEIMYQGNGGWSSSGQTMFYLNNNGTTAGTHAGAVRWAGGWLTGTAALNNNSWHFVTLVDNAGTETIYVDGNVDTVTATMANPLATSANQLWIGGSPDGGDGAVRMSGMIDEVYMFNRALSQAEVQSLYNNNAITNNPVNTLPVATTVTVAPTGVLDLSGVSQTIAGLSGGGWITNSGAACALTISNATGATLFGGTIADATTGNAINLVKAGVGLAGLAGVNTYHGNTVISGGTLKLAPVADDSVLHL
ncbi:MAG TPA: LamG-like jellyroll fold domain-containing protein, partial [Verrucomicrobiae bacterium]